MINFALVEAQPTETEKKVYDEVAVVLERAPSIIADLQKYQGAGEQIREVIFAIPINAHYGCLPKYQLCTLRIVDNINIPY